MSPAAPVLTVAPTSRRSRMRGLSVGTKILMAVALVTAVALGTGILAVSRMGRLDDQISRAQAHITERLVQLAAIRGAATAVNANIAFGASVEQFATAWTKHIGMTSAALFGTPLPAGITM